jgi:hypothetical protein
MNLTGNVSEPAAREIVTCPSSDIPITQYFCYFSKPQKAPCFKGLSGDRKPSTPQSEEFDSKIHREI